VFATCPTVVMCEAHLSLLGHHSSDGTAAVDRLPISIEGYRPLVQRHIVVVVVVAAMTEIHDTSSCLLL
jgi:hypothetical protein